MLISDLAKIHNGFWFWKYCFLAGLLILYFYIINIEEIDEFRESLKTFSRMKIKHFRKKFCKLFYPSLIFQYFHSLVRK